MTRVSADAFMQSTIQASFITFLLILAHGLSTRGMIPQHGIYFRGRYTSFLHPSAVTTVKVSLTEIVSNQETDTESYIKELLKIYKTPIPSYYYENGEDEEQEAKKLIEGRRNFLEQIINKKSFQETIRNNEKLSELVYETICTILFTNICEFEKPIDDYSTKTTEYQQVKSLLAGFVSEIVNNFPTCTKLFQLFTSREFVIRTSTLLQSPLKEERQVVKDFFIKTVDRFETLVILQSNIIRERSLNFLDFNPQKKLVTKVTSESDNHLAHDQKVSNLVMKEPGVTFNQSLTNSTSTKKVQPTTNDDGDNVGKFKDGGVSGENSKNAEELEKVSKYLEVYADAVITQIGMALMDAGSGKKFCLRPLDQVFHIFKECFVHVCPRKMSGFIINYLLPTLRKNSIASYKKEMIEAVVDAVTMLDDDSSESDMVHSFLLRMTVQNRKLAFESIMLELLVRFYCQTFIKVQFRTNILKKIVSVARKSQHFQIKYSVTKFLSSTSVQARFNTLTVGCASGNECPMVLRFLFDGLVEWISSANVQSGIFLHLKGLWNQMVQSTYYENCIVKFLDPTREITLKVEEKLSSYVSTPPLADSSD